MEKKKFFDLLKLALLSWISMLALDFFLHAGILANLYTQSNPFLLPLEKAFALIPVGYASFLLLAVLLVWLMDRMSISGWRRGAVFGLQLGLLIWGSFILRLYSISTAAPNLLIGWFFGQVLELSIGGVVVGIGLKYWKLKRLSGLIAGQFVLSVILGIVWQNIF